MKLILEVCDKWLLPIITFVVLFGVAMVAIGSCSRADERQDSSERKITVLSFTAEWCPSCRRLDRAWETTEVSQALDEIKAQHYHLDVDGMTDAQLAQWKVKAIPVTIIGERLENGSVRELRRLNGAVGRDELRRFIRGAK